MERVRLFGRSRSGTRPSRVVRRRGIPLAAAGAVAVATVLAGCSSSHSDSANPSGISDNQAQQLNSQQFSAEDAAAKTVLTPEPGSFLAGKTTVSMLASTTPANGDVNPYAILPITQDTGSLHRGDVLVDNFNAASNKQGTGTTIVNVHPDKSVSVFAQIPQKLAGCPGGVGLSTAMVQLHSGWVIVGSAPTTDGTMSTAGAGCLIMLSPTGQVGGTAAGDYLKGPWDAALSDNGTAPVMFVSNTMNNVPASGATVNQGTVVRLNLTEGAGATPPTVTGHSTIVDALPERSDASALVKGPTGLALGSDGRLFIADTLDNRITAVPNALTTTATVATGDVVSSGGQLAQPLAMAVAPNHNLLVANAQNGKIVEVTPAGKQVGEFYAIQNVGQDPPGNGDLFGIAVTASGDGLLFVGDDNNDVMVLH